MSRIIFNREDPPRTTAKKKRLTQYQRKLLRKIQEDWKATQPCICPICCINRAIELHHIIPKGMGGNPMGEVEENWIFICRSCHNGFHGGKIPLACVLRAKKDLGGLDLVKLKALAGNHRLIPDVSLESIRTVVH